MVSIGVMCLAISIIIVNAVSAISVQKRTIYKQTPAEDRDYSKFFEIKHFVDYMIRKKLPPTGPGPNGMYGGSQFCPYGIGPYPGIQGMACYGPNGPFPGYGHGPPPPPPTTTVPPPPPSSPPPPLPPIPKEVDGYDEEEDEEYEYKPKKRCRCRRCRHRR